MARHFPIAFFLATLIFCAPALADQPQVGDILPAFTITPFAVEGDATDLGLEEGKPFTLADLPAEYALIEVIGVYCPVCHKMAPSITRLFKRLKKTKLNKKIAVFGLAAGATPMEVQHVRSKQYVFPVAHDTEYEIHKALGEPKTPFTLIVDRQGKVLYAHLGIIPDFNAFYKDIQALVK